MAEAVISGFIGIDESGDGPVADAMNIDFDGAVARRRLDRVRLSELDPSPYYWSLAPGRVDLLREVVWPNGERVLVAVLVGPYALDCQIGTVGGRNESFTRTAGIQADGGSYLRTLGCDALMYRGNVIVTNPSGLLWRVNGSGISRLVASRGADVGEPGGRSYLGTPPKADRLVIWRNRLVTIRGNTVGLSADDNDTQIPPGYDGSNLWPARTNFSVRSEGGDPIVAAGVTTDDRLVLVSRRTIWIVDEDEVSPVAMVAEPRNGCIAPRSFVSIGSKGFMYLSDRRICRYEPSSGIEDVGGDLVRTLDTLVDWESARSAVAVHVAQRNEYRLWVPIRGSAQNRLCLIYDYARKAWRKYAGWWTFDNEANQGAAYDVTAAATVMRGGRELVVTGDSLGRFWLEDAGDETDSAASFPAFIRFKAVGSGMATLTYRAWRAEVQFDGAPLRAHALHDGESFEQEVMRHKAAIARRDEDLETTLNADDQSTYGSLTAWGNVPHVGRWDAIKMSFGERGTRLSPVIVYPGATTAGVRRSARGGVRMVEFVAETPRRRSGAGGP